MPESDDPREAYADALRRRLHDDSLHEFIPLNVQLLTASPQTVATTLTRLISQNGETRVAVLGDPGAGKTTLAKQLCTSFLPHDPVRVPVFVELKRYNPDRHDVGSLVRDQLQALGTTDLGVVSLIVFDGLNEVRGGMIYDALREIQDLAGSPAMNGVPIVLTCRTIDYRTSFSTQFSRYVVQPPPESEALAYLEGRLEEQPARDLWEELPLSMRSLCRSPLLLGMLAFVLERSPDITGNVPRNRSALYKEFLRRLDDRTRERAQMATPRDIREIGYARIAYAMENERVEMPLEDMQRIVTEFVFRSEWQIPIQTLQEDILGSPPLGAIGASGPDTDSRSFMHQSFQEYYTAQRIYQELNSNPRDRLLISDYAEKLHPDAVAWRETFAFLSGMLPDSTELVQACREQRNKALTSACIQHAVTVAPADVDNFIFEVLEEFKYGDSFDYGLVFFLPGAVPRSSPELPQRVISDINYWCSKYSRATPEEIGKEISDDAVIATASAGAFRDRLDALWTLGLRACQAATPVLEDLALHDQDDLVRENAVLALGRIKADSSLPALLQIARSPNEAQWVRMYAIHALSFYPSPDTVQVLLTGLTDPGWANLADDAAWALSDLAESAPHLLQPSLPRFFDVLGGAADCYTKGCVLFAIARGGFTEAGPQMISYLENERDPYILEDGCNALGMLGLQASVPFLSQIADPSAMHDPMTRLRAIRALIKLDHGALPAVQNASQDPTAYIRGVVAAFNRAGN